MSDHREHACFHCGSLICRGQCQQVFPQEILERAKLPTCRILHGPAQRFHFLDLEGDKPMVVIVDRSPDGIIFVFDIREATRDEIVTAPSLRKVRRLFQRPIE